MWVFRNAREIKVCDTCHAKIEPKVAPVTDLIRSHQRHFCNRKCATAYVEPKPMRALKPTGT